MLNYAITHHAFKDVRFLQISFFFTGISRKGGRVIPVLSTIRDPHDPISRYTLPSASVFAWNNCFSHHTPLLPTYLCSGKFSLGCSSSNSMDGRHSWGSYGHLVKKLRERSFHYSAYNGLVFSCDPAQSNPYSATPLLYILFDIFCPMTLGFSSLYLLFDFSCIHNFWLGPYQ